VFGVLWAVKQQRRQLLYGLWEPVSGEGVYFQFTKDGALVRGDGVATRYRWLSNDIIELYTDDASPKVQIEVLSLSKMELIVRADGQGGHFKKGVTVTEQASKEAWAKAGALAGGAAMLALGGLAILGGMAAGAAMGAGGGGSSGREGVKAKKCGGCNGRGYSDHSGKEKCLLCYGRGVIYLD
jgi:hypothetical protein